MLLDRFLGEPRRFHPLVGFGHWAQFIESRLNRGHRLLGLLAWTVAVMPWVTLAWAFQQLAPGGLLVAAIDIALLYFSLGAQSLKEHADAVLRPLQAGDLDEARQKVGWMVSRDTSSLDETGVAKAGLESVLENGNDAIFGTLFWFAIAGGPGALLFRLANTLDAMWGYRTPRFLQFGWAAARIDDALNWLPARLTALSYALMGNAWQALTCWKSQAPKWDSPNAGPVMAAGAGSLGVVLGGKAIYHGQEEQRPPLGCGAPPLAKDLAQAIRLVQRSLVLWLAFFVLIDLIFKGTIHA